jgi:hypothetical protein
VEVPDVTQADNRPAKHACSARFGGELRNRIVVVGEGERKQQRSFVTEVSVVWGYWEKEVSPKRF